MIIKRMRGAPATTRIVLGRTEWYFSPDHTVFSVSEEDLPHILDYGNFDLAIPELESGILTEDVQPARHAGERAGSG